MPCSTWPSARHSRRGSGALLLPALALMIVASASACAAGHALPGVSKARGKDHPTRPVVRAVREHTAPGVTGAPGSTYRVSGVRGRVLSAWKRSQRAFEAAFEVPDGVDATGLTPALDALVAPGSPAFTGIASTLMTMKMNGWVGTAPAKSLGNPVVTAVQGRSASVSTCFYDTQIAVGGHSRLPVRGPLGVVDHVEMASTMVVTASGAWQLYSTTTREVAACPPGS